jgi:glycosyltransferase involved in cell wall biosynthesis
VSRTSGLRRNAQWSIPDPATRAQPMPGVSVVIPVFEHLERLGQALGAIEEQDYTGPFEIVVVDNGAPHVERIVRRASHARLVREPRPGSYAARNRGIAAARFEILAFTDADCIPDPHWLATGVRALLEHPSCGFVAGRIDLFVTDPERPTIAEIYESVAAFRQQAYVERSRFAASANLFTRRRVFERVGLFDDNLQSLGDCEWGRRVHAAGLSQHYVDQAAVAHPARRTVGELLRRARRITGGYYNVSRLRRPHPSAVLRDAPLGLAFPWRAYGVPPGRRAPSGFREKALVMLTALAVTLVRLLELARLFSGGRAHRL